MTIDANDLERMAKERPDVCFLKGSGVLKLIDGIRRLEGELSTAHELHDEMFAALTAALFLAPHNSPVREALDEAVENIRPKWIRPAASVISFPDPNLGPKTDHFPLPPAKAQAYADTNGLALAPAPLGRWIKGIPPSHVDLAWLRVEYPGGYFRVVLGTLATHDSNARHPLEWCEAADWRGESVLDSVHTDGGHIRHWLPYVIPSKNWPTSEGVAP